MPARRPTSSSPRRPRASAASRPPRRALAEARIVAAERRLDEFEQQVVRLPPELQGALSSARAYCQTAIARFNALWQADPDPDARLRIEVGYELLGEALEHLINEITVGTADDSLPLDLVPTMRSWLEVEDHEITLRARPVDSYISTTRGRPTRTIRTRLQEAAPQGAWSPRFWTTFDVPLASREMTLRHLIMLGHEVAHAQDVETGGRSRGLGKGAKHPSNFTEEQVKRVTGVISKWIGELVADVAAVRRVGPAVVIAMAEVSHRRRPTESHPPLGLRLRMMDDELRVLGYTAQGLGAVGATISSWRQQQFPSSGGDVILEDARRVVEQQLTAIRQLARSLVPDGRAYSPRSFATTAAIADDLVDGIARSDRYNGRRSQPLGIVDLFNAAMRVRVGRLADLARTIGAEGDGGEVRALETLDRLLKRAIEGVFLEEEWRRIGLPGPPEEAERVTARSRANSSGVLSRGEIESRLVTRRGPTRRGQREPIVVTPLIDPQVSAGTLDVRLGRHFIALRRTRIPGFDLLRMIRELQRDGWTSRQILEELAIRFNRSVEKIYVPLGDEFVLHPYQLVLAGTLEYIALPGDVGAHVLSRSSTGRLGIISATATYVHARFHGVVTLELVNTGETPVSIAPGMRIAQLLFVRAGGGARPGRYQLSTEPEISQLAFDRDLERLARARPLPNLPREPRPTPS
ncbi:MAG: dCTP deaminase [Chloroflexota bacterium]